MKLVSPELQAGGRRAWYTALFCPWALLCILVAGISALFTLVTKLGDGVASGYTDDVFYCDSSSVVRYKFSNQGYDPVSPYWDYNLFLSVTMGFHGLSFNYAKAIDICFDLVVGRGSQVLLALATYPILRRSILRSMEVREFSLALLLPFFLERISVYSLWALFANMRARRTKPKTDVEDEQIKFRKARIRIDWRVVLIFLVGCYVLALPTFASVMTSYQVRSKPFRPDGLSYVSTEALQKPDYLLEDGEKYGLSAYYPMYNDDDLLPTCLEYNDALFEGFNYTSSNDDAAFNAAYESYIKTDVNDEAGKEKVREIFNRYKETLPTELSRTDDNDPPQWWITVQPRYEFYLNSDFLVERNSTALLASMVVIGNITYDMNGLFLSVSPNIMPGSPFSNSYTRYGWRLAYNNETFLASDVERIGKCLPGDDYIWGFSSLILFWFFMMTIVVALILLVLHYEAYFNSAADRYKLYISPYRDLLDLAEEFRVHYGSAATADMPAKELDKAMREDPVTTGLETEILHRARRERWKQAKASASSRYDAWKRSKAADGQAGTDAEESLMAMGSDVQLHSDMELAKLPARVASRSTSGA